MKKNIAVFFGGRSAEHDVSIITGHIPIINSLMAIGDFNVYPIYITKEGQWYSKKEMNDLDYFKQADYEDDLKKKDKVKISFEGGLKIMWPGIKERSVQIDLVFPAMHGTYGEDGSLMGLLRMANVPFVGCDLFASCVAMDKVLTKQVVAVEGMDVVPFVWFTKNDWIKEKTSLLEKIGELKWPLFVKPAHLGSSIAITKVKKKEDLENAIEVALHYDDKILIEESVEDLTEVTLPIMGNEDLQLAGIEKPLNRSEFFDFSGKYLSSEKGRDGVNNQTSEIPAKIEKDLEEKVKDFGRRTYRVLGCSGIARVDFLIDNKSNTVYVNEVNTLPGSLYHHNWKEMGVSSIDLVKRLIELAEDRFLQKKELSYAFQSDILKKAGGSKLNN